MSHLLSSDAFLDSKLPVGVNAVKNILFRAATLILHFVVYRMFSLWAFKNRDYTSFLMFGEDIVQKTMFAISRRFNRQGALVMLFAVVMIAAGFYDTLLWGLDFPGYIVKVTRTNAGLLSSQMIDSPTYVMFLSDPKKNPDLINLNDTFSANLYTTGSNYTLPGVVAPGFQQVVPVLVPISSFVAPSIWLESDGFAVGLDETIMTTTTMNATYFCVPFNSVDSPTTLQTWHCVIQNSDALELFDQNMAKPQIWWDSKTPEYLLPVRNDNPWQSLGTGGDTALMEQVFTVTRGTHRHTFLQTTLKATMISRAPVLLDDGEITDFMRRLWSDDQTLPITPAVQSLADFVIQAKNNGTSITFGSFLKTDNITVTAISTEYFNILAANTLLYTTLRFVSNTITLLRSEVLFQPPTPFTTCDQAYSNVATGGVARSSNCYNFNPIGSSNASRFLGQIDTSSVVIMSDILGNGEQNISSKALSASGLDWYRENAGTIDQLLISRGIILGGVRAAVQVDVRTNEAALSYLQLLLSLIPVLLALVAYGFTARRSMSYFKNSLLSALYSTTHLTNDPNDNTSCKKAGYIRFPTDIYLRLNGEHVVLGTADGGVISNVANIPASYGQGLSYQPLLLREDSGMKTPTTKEGSS